MSDFTGRTAVVTGGAGGIGAAISLLLKQRGAHVIATGISEAEILRRTENPGFGGIRFDRLDVADPIAVDRFAAGLDRLDILVNCAGVNLRGPAAFEEEGFDRILQVNLYGTMRMSRACHPLLARQGGAIVNLASMMSIFGSAMAPGYSASKGGVTQLTKSLALAWARDGIRVNAVAPGWIETERTIHTIKQNDPEKYHQVVQRTPMGRWGEPEYIAHAVSFLCSSDAKFITGVMLPVDGGYSCN